MKVVIIGSGNVATILGRKIKDSGSDIVQVISKNEKNAASLASILVSSYTSNFLEINKEADIYIIAVSDSEIGEISSKLQLGDKVIAHTAASVTKEILQLSSTNYGVLYPLQSLKKEMHVIPTIPVLVDGNNADTLEFLRGFAAEWADNVTVAIDEERLKLHVAAVFASNFTNHILALTENYCKRENLNFNVLYPLIEETVKRVKSVTPALVQTGPAIRGDIETVNKHLQILSAHPAISGIYKLLTESIISFTTNKSG
jgi:predicted short-subunit dehydrogenase-like oxidoreductase (DUF2520 family)